MLANLFSKICGTSYNKSQMNIQALRMLLRPFVGDLKDNCTNNSIPELCINLGLPVPAEGGDKRGRLHLAFDTLNDEALPSFAENLLNKRLLVPKLRNQVQDILWANIPSLEISKRGRREIARALQSHELFQHWKNFSQLIEDLFIIPTDISALCFGTKSRSILDDIHQHFVRNPEDANVELLFEQLEVFDLSEKRFSLLLEGLVSAAIQVDAENQFAIVGAINPILKACGAEMRQTDEADGYPVFTLLPMHNIRGRPKNIIFASSSKPDIRFRDAVNNDIEIVSNQEDCLVYDRPLGTDGLRWRELQQWWAEVTHEDIPEKAKKALYRRLQACIPPSSPPQGELFKLYFQSFGLAIPDLPALLPEVWLHWDPKTVKQRGPQALLTHRMDFLMLLPGGARIVIEVDGVQHYANTEGRASPQQYAHLVNGDRELQLAGYEVYRFAGIELQDLAAPTKIKSFFEALFNRYGIDLP